MWHGDGLSQWGRSKRPRIRPGNEKSERAMRVVIGRRSVQNMAKNRATIGSGQYTLLSGRPVQTGQVLFEFKFTTAQSGGLFIKQILKTEMPTSEKKFKWQKLAKIYRFKLTLTSNLYLDFKRLTIFFSIAESFHILLHSQLITICYRFHSFGFLKYFFFLSWDWKSFQKLIIINIVQGVCVGFVFSALMEYALVNYALR